MVKVVATWKHSYGQVCEPSESQAGLDLPQSLRVDNAQRVTQDTAAWIDVRIDSHYTPYSRRTMARI